MVVMKYRDVTHISRDYHRPYLAYSRFRAVHPSGERSPATGPLVHSRLVVQTDSSILFIPHSDIICCKAESNYTRVLLNNGNSVLVSKPLKWIAAQLPTCDSTDPGCQKVFIRVHQSYLIQARALKKIIKGTKWMCHLIDGQKVPVSRARRKDLAAAFCV